MKRALILATGTYADSRITPLKSPVPDAERLRLLLIRDDVGPYEVTMLSDAGLMAQQVAIERYFQAAGPQDTLLLFVSGHGDKDADGDLYFFAQDTDRDLLSATAIGANFVSRQAARSRAAQKVLVIDTCYSGAFAKGHVFKSGAGSITAEDFGAESTGSGRGTAIITAASSTQLASEADAGGRMQSRFTRHLIEGIETGAADANGTGSITLDELFDYVRSALRREGPGQEPKRLNAIDGDMVIARNPVRRAVPLPAGLLRRIVSKNWESRASACIALGEAILRGGDDKASALAALRALATDPDDRVKRRALSELAQTGEMAEAAETPAPTPATAPTPAKIIPAKAETPSKPKPDPKLSAADADANAALRAALLMRPPTGDAASDETSKDGGAEGDTPVPPKPKLDNIAKGFIGLFVVLLLVMLIVFLKPDDPVTPPDTLVTDTSVATDDAMTPTDTPTTTPAYDGSAFGTGASEYSFYQVTSVTDPTLAGQCNVGNTTATGDACNNLGLIVEKGDGGEPNYIVATILYEKACYYGSVVGCANAGTRLTTTTGGVTPNWDRAQAFLNAACNKDDGLGCEKLGWLYENRVSPDIASAISSYSKACTLNITTACTSRDRLQGSAM